MFDYHKHDDESVFAYKWRVYRYKLYGDCTDSWQYIAEQMNKEFQVPLTESVYRKEAALVSSWYDNYFNGELSPDSQASELLEQVRQERVKLADERNQRNRSTRGAARLERRLDAIEAQMINLGKAWYPCQYTKPRRRDRERGQDMVVLLSDWHLGLKFDNAFGEFDLEIAEARLEKYLEEIEDVRTRYDIHVCHVVSLGDMISGNIHRTIQVQNQDDVIDQVKRASEMMCGFLNRLCKMFDDVDYMGIDGNHSRLTVKDDAVKSERLDNIIPWAVKNFLHDLDNFTVLDPIDSTLGVIKIRQLDYAFVHGDFDALSTGAVSKIAFMLKRIPYAVCMGHMHYPVMADVNGVKVVQCGCLCGTGDDYTISKRLTGSASQTILICSNRGIEKYFPVNLEL